MRTATPRLDLLEHERARRVGHVGRDLHAAVHRAGVHHDRVRLHRGEPRARSCRRAARTRAGSGTACPRRAPSGCAACRRRRGRRARSSRSLARTSAPSTSGRAGSSVGGAMTIGVAPTLRSAGTSEPATRRVRRCRRRCRPSAPRGARGAARIVYRSSSACVGCWCIPSPPLTTRASITSVSICGAPAYLCRTTTRSHAIADSVAAVSRSDLALHRGRGADAGEVDARRRDRRFAAISKLVRVRVDGSRKRLTTVRPRSVGSFLMRRSLTSANDSAVSRIVRDVLGA